MKFAIVTVVLSVAALAYSGKPHYELSDAPVLFEQFIKDYHKFYKDQNDKKEHYEAFVLSLKIINEANAASDSATFDINNLSDYTEAQRKKLFGFIKESFRAGAV